MYTPELPDPIPQTDHTMLSPQYSPGMPPLPEAGAAADGAAADEADQRGAGGAALHNSAGQQQRLNEESPVLQGKSVREPWYIAALCCIWTRVWQC